MDDPPARAFLRRPVRRRRRRGGPGQDRAALASRTLQRQDQGVTGPTLTNVNDVPAVLVCD
jgi:hypothetical protein